jgi:hypothetical protein
VRSKEVSHRVKEETNNLRTSSRRITNWMGHILRRKLSSKTHNSAFHSNNSFANALQYYVTRTLLLLSEFILAYRV